MNSYKVKAYYKGLLRMEIVAKGMKMAQAYKRVYMQDYGFQAAEIDIIKMA